MHVLLSFVLQHARLPKESPTLAKRSFASQTYIHIYRRLPLKKPRTLFWDTCMLQGGDVYIYVYTSLRVLGFLRGRRLYICIYVSFGRRACCKTCTKNHDFYSGRRACCKTCVLGFLRGRRACCFQIEYRGFIGNVRLRGNVAELQILQAIHEGSL